ncbi:uncharacterized protein LOC143192798 isoform X3 [Rhynchophorus ferrugineus]|uniref:uncharacterized protein LOC143192798 isoform X3 n=1 Tax=Rhynchophorus ferrugineus TaxID=354439 RepID=UPI003FCED0BD
MAPLPDNDKAPDKIDKNKQEKSKDRLKGSHKDEKTLSNLNDRELKALLDEAINYKNPKDREGKSELFNDLLLEAEETERIARATSAGGSELVRHCNPTARRHRPNGGSRGRRYGCPSSSGLVGRSVSERGTHGGSLDNLAKEELYETTRRLRGGRKSSTSSSGASSSCGSNQVRVSARQREGGSLPCNVNAGDSSRDFFDETKRPKDVKQKGYTVVDMETEGLLENDHLQSQRENSAVTTITGPKFTTNATLQIKSNCASTNVTNVDESIQLALESGSEKNADSNSIAKMVPVPKYSVIISPYIQILLNDRILSDLEKSGNSNTKVDENGNALQQNKEKKKKKQAEETFVMSQNIAGHKSDIINNIDELVQFIEGDTENKARSTQSSKSKQLHNQHNSDDGGSRTYRKKHSKIVSKENGSTSNSRHELKKSNSLGEISEMKLGREFEGFSGKSYEDNEKVVLRTNKNTTDRARERRSWGNVETPTFQNFYNASSLEHLETSTDNWVVTRPKKKSKKRRNSVSSASAARQNSLNSGITSSVSNEEARSMRGPSPDLGVGANNVKTTRSMPHSEKSNDSSSDVDSVHSLPMDGPISYADIAKNSEKKKPSPEKQEKSLSTKEKSPQVPKHEFDLKYLHKAHNASPLDKFNSSSVSPNVNNSSVNKNIVPDVHNIKSFPAITGTITKTSTAVISSALSHHSGMTTMTTDKAVQSTLAFEESFVREKTSISSVKNNNSGVPLQIVETLTISEVIHSTPATNNLAPLTTVATLNTPVSSKRQPLPTPGATNKTKCNKDTLMNSDTNRDSLGSQHNQMIIARQSEVQNDLPFFSQLMRDTAQYATQRMPPDIMDVSTIEKLHFMNCSLPQIIPGQCSAANNSTQMSFTNLSNTVIARENIGNINHNKNKRKKGGNSSKMNGPKDESGLSSVCDSNLGERNISSILNGVSDETFSSPEPSNQPNSLPPVVILSGHNKDVPSGLVFGFDINEQLLLEDTRGGGEINFIVNTQNISENSNENTLERLNYSKGEELAKRYKPPINDKNQPKHNHEKIVSFISHAWDNIVSQNVQYFSDELYKIQG